jgi:hypothetical protein
MPATLREARMPISRPLMTRPTARPGGGGKAAMGTSTWAATENSRPWRAGGQQREAAGQAADARQQHAAGGQQHQGQNQAAALQHIAQRHQKQQAQAIGDLGHGHGAGGGHR